MTDRLTAVLLAAAALLRGAHASFACARQDAVCEALGALYASTNGPGWASAAGWRAAAAGTLTSYCTLANVGCLPSGEVEWLYLESNGLSGTLPASLGNVTSLQRAWAGRGGARGAGP